MRRRWSVAPAGLAMCALAGSSAPPRAADTLARPTELVGLYRMEVPEAMRPSARLRFPKTEVTFLRLLADGRSRLENVTLEDRDGTIVPRVEVGPAARAPWGVRVPTVLERPAAALAQLCVEQGGAVSCQRYERDAETGDVTLFQNASASSATLRLERVR